MFRLIDIDQNEILFDFLGEAKEEAQRSGLGIDFWRETLSKCVKDEAMWNEFLSNLWQSGAKSEADRLDRTFPKDVPRNWLLIALTLNYENPWEAFLGEWRVRSDERIMSVVGSSAFAPWLKQVQPLKYDFLTSVLGEDTVKWSNNLLLKALKAETEDEVVALKAMVEKRQGPKPGDEMTIELSGGAQMEFCWCPAGSFMMGSPETEEGHNDDETQHRVTLTRGFWMCKYEVTQAQWESVMGTNPSRFKGADRPVECVTWNMCQKFIQKVNAAGKVRVLLPTEAQWEYACRAGTTTPFSFGSTLNGDKANCDGNYPYGTATKGRYRAETAPVGSYSPNGWGLYDMHGNVDEWCQDWYDSYPSSSVVDPTGPASGSFRSRRVLRGGSWYSSAYSCRSAYRDDGVPFIEDRSFGFRLCCFAGLQGCADE